MWVPSGLVLVNRMLDMAKLTPKDILYDLGSGDGRHSHYGAPNAAHAPMASNTTPDMVALSKRNAVREGVAERATFEQADIFPERFFQSDSGLRCFCCRS